MPVPDRIGRYDYRGTIGVGGFATVVRGYDPALDSLVAVKILTEQWANDPEIRARFLQEGKLLRRIHNEHVVTVHDSGTLDDGRPYFVMDYADRGTLEERLGFTAPGRAIDARTTRTWCWPSPTASPRCIAPASSIATSSRATCSSRPRTARRRRRRRPPPPSCAPSSSRPASG